MTGMANALRVTLEVGPKGRNVAAVAPDWPGLERGARTAEAAVDRLQACWTFFDDVRMRVSAEMRKGPRGGGRDRDRIVLHTLGTEQEWAQKLGVGTRQGARVTDADGLTVYRANYCTAMRTFHSQRRMARTWPLRFLIRHSAYHTMDHAWEMEDKDLTGDPAQTRLP